ncbi:MAG: hypothetical protein KF819_12625 [Labilithrix sp.]|nr:hypothetical protein [Labilithrix sp.]
MRAPLIAFLGLSCVAACGGRVDEPGPPAATSTNGPSNAAMTTGCAGACAWLGACATSYEARDCIAWCARDFPEPERAQTYAACVARIPCDEIDRALSMDYGPLGACYAEAKNR